MRRCSLLSFLILSCVQILYGLELVGFHKLENEDPKVFKHLMVVQEKKGPNGGSDNGNFHKNGDGEGFPEKAQRAKGSYGGANLAHGRPTEKSAASVLQNPRVFIPTTIVCISIFLLPVNPLLIV